MAVNHSGYLSAGPAPPRGPPRYIDARPGRTGGEAREPGGSRPWGLKSPPCSGDKIRMRTELEARLDKGRPRGRTGRGRNGNPKAEGRKDPPATGHIRTRAMSPKVRGHFQKVKTNKIILNNF